MALFEEYVIPDKQHNSFFMGQVVLSTHNGQDFRRPVALNDPRAGNINLFLLRYDSAGEGSFVPENDVVQCKLSDVLAPVVLEACASGVLKMDPADLKHIEKLVNGMTTPKPRP